MVDFSAVLNKKVEDIEKPKPLPIGTYVCIVDGLGEIKTVGKDETPCVNFKLKVMSPGVDVDAEALNAAGGVNNRSVRHTLWLTEDAAWRAKKFLAEDLGIDPHGKTLMELINEAPGRSCMVNIKHRPSEDGQTLYAEIKSTAAV